MTSRVVSKERKAPSNWSTSHSFRRYSGIRSRPVRSSKSSRTNSSQLTCSYYTRLSLKISVSLKRRILTAKRTWSIRLRRRKCWFTVTKSTWLSPSRVHLSVSHLAIKSISSTESSKLEVERKFRSPPITFSFAAQASATPIGSLAWLCTQDTIQESWEIQLTRNRNFPSLSRCWANPFSLSWWLRL